MEVTNHIFVYGTLAPELAPPEIGRAVRKLKFVGNGYVRGRLYDLGEFPGVKLGKDPKFKVWGRIYELPGDEKTIRSLDKYEEFDPARPESSLYTRKLADAVTDSGESIRCWIYEYNPIVPPKSLIRSGVYR